MTEKTPGAKRQERYEMSKNRIVWATILRKEFILYHHTDGLNPDLQGVGIEFRPRTGKFSLTAWTEAELDVFAEFMKRAIEEARPICRELDQRALAEYKEGNDVHIRLYRATPRLYSHGSIEVPVTPTESGLQSGDDPSLQE